MVTLYVIAHRPFRPEHETSCLLLRLGQTLIGRNGNSLCHWAIITMFHCLPALATTLTVYVFANLAP